MAIRRFKTLEGFGWEGVDVDAGGYIYRLQNGPVLEVIIRAGEEDIAVNINQLIEDASGNAVPKEETTWSNFDLPVLTMEEFLASAIRVDAGDSVVLGAGEIAIGDKGVYCIAMAAPDAETTGKVYGGVTKAK